MAAGRIILDPVRPSAAVRARVQRELLKRWEFMRGQAEQIISLYRRIRAAQDAADKKQEAKKPFSDSAATESVDRLVAEAQKLLRKIRNDFNRKFPAPEDDKLAEEFIRWCNTDTERRNKLAFKRAVKDFTVRIRMTRQKKALLRAAAGEAAGLIKSLGSKAQDDLAGAVNRCLMEGRNLGELTEAVQKVLHSTRRRAINIAFDQVNKVEAAVDRQIKLELGLNRAIWRHSHAYVRTKPRASHVAADGKEFDLARGCKIDGEYILPSSLPYCRCYAQAVLTLPEVKE